LTISYLGMKIGSIDYCVMVGLKYFAAGEKNLKLFTDLRIKLKESLVLFIKNYLEKKYLWM